MILCCGEALIDMIAQRPNDERLAFVPHVGGAVFNTAIALGRLGRPVGFFGGLSTDPFGDMLAASLAASHVDCSLVVRSDRPSTLAFVHLTDGQARYSFFDENSAMRMLTEADLPALAPDIEALHFSCISLVSEPGASAYEALMRREHGRRVVMLDPNIRSGFITDRHAHAARLKRMIAMADIVKLSDEDLAWFGEEGSHDAIAARWLDAGPRLMVITRGGKGATGYTVDLRIELAAPQVAVADTVGAGDTFNAGLLAWLDMNARLEKSRLAALDEASLRAALAFAMRAAAITVSRPGADPPWRAELA